MAKRSKVVEFAKNPIVIVIGIIITLFGGIPGICSTIDYFNKGPKFHYYSTSMVAGNSEPGKKQIIFIFGTIFNDGKSPLLVNGFELNMSVNGKNYSCTPYRIPEKLNLLGDSNILDYKDAAKKDFVLIKTINPLVPITGDLLFSTDAPGQEIIKPHHVHYTLTCIDLSGNRYDSEFDMVGTQDLHTWHGIPKDDISVLPRDSFPIRDSSNKR